MKNQARTQRNLSLVVGLALLASTTPASQEPVLSAETFGRASGDVPMRGLGLVLELVQDDPAHPMLRLFGGPAGQPATLFISRQRRDEPLAGVRGTEFLLG